jgi:hypothetical protein
MQELPLRFELLSAVKWYFQSKNFSLRNALSLRTPLSVSDQADLRMNFSQYFVSLGSVTELLSEPKRAGAADFKKLLHVRLDPSGDAQAGKATYDFTRELRNAIVHRGLDIAAAAHIAGNFPLLLLPDRVSDRKGTRSYAAPAKYVLELVGRLEATVGPVIDEHLHQMGLFEENVSTDELRENHLRYVHQSTAMPEHIKELALRGADALDYLVVFRSFLQGVRGVLVPQPLSVPA